MNKLKLARYMHLIKPTGTYIFLNILVSFIGLGWILLKHNSFKTTETLYLYLMIFFIQYCSLVYIGLKSKQINTYTALGVVILFAVPVAQENLFLLLWKLSIISFTIGYILEVLKISFDFDLERYLAIKIRGKK